MRRRLGRGGRSSSHRRSGSGCCAVMARVWWSALFLFSGGRSSLPAGFGMPAIALPDLATR
eukprot:2363182-Amphidinium_carterae.1